MKDLVKWLYTNISKYSNDKNKDLLDTLFLSLINFIKKHDELYLEEDLETFKVLFYQFMYTKNVDNIDEKKEVFVLKYTDEITDLFLKLKDISNSYGSVVLNKKCFTSNHLVEFLTQNIYIQEKEMKVDEDLIIED